MEQGDRSSSATHKPKDPGQQLPGNIPAMFRVNAGEGYAALGPEQQRTPPGSSCPPSEAGHNAMQPAQSLSLTDLQCCNVAMDIKSTLAVVITDLKADIRAIATRMGTVEQTLARHADPIRQVQKNFRYAIVTYH